MPGRRRGSACAFRKIDYYKYAAEKMGSHRRYNTNGFAEPRQVRDSHVVADRQPRGRAHLYRARRASVGFLQRGNCRCVPDRSWPAGNFESVFNGLSVHQACRQYLQLGTLALPLDRVVTTNDFRAMSDDVLSYRQAGSFVRFAIVPMVSTASSVLPHQQSRRQPEHDQAAVRERCRGLARKCRSILVDDAQRRRDVECRKSGSLRIGLQTPDHFANARTSDHCQTGDYRRFGAPMLPVFQELVAWLGHCSSELGVPPAF